MHVNIIKTIIDDNGSNFKIGDDVCFILNRNNKAYNCFGVIKDINETEFCIKNVQIDKMNVLDMLKIKYSEVEKGIFHLTDNTYY